MKINPIFKIRKVAGESLILLQGKSSGDLTRVVAFNTTAQFLWESLYEKDFATADAVRLLLDSYEVDEPTATADAEKWVETLRENGLLLSE